MSETGNESGPHCELRALVIRAFTLLDAAADADIKGIPLHPGAWHSELATWQKRYQAYLETETSRH